MIPVGQQRIQLCQLSHFRKLSSVYNLLFTWHWFNPCHVSLLNNNYYMFGRTKKVVGVLNWSRASETSAVSREVPMTKELLTFLTETQGILIHGTIITKME